MPRGQYPSQERICIDCSDPYMSTSNAQKRCPKCKVAINKVHHASWVSRNRERNLETSRRSYRKNRLVAIARVRRWIENNYDKWLEYSNSTHHKRRGSFVEHVSRSVVLTRDKGICGICGTEVDPDNYVLDHIIPLSRGGFHGYENVQVAHPQCNSWKHSKLPEEYDAIKQQSVL